MKAHYGKKLAKAKGNGPFHGHELRLTIGMIVKNEEKNLDKCLSSLVPLLKAVPSELIITDTGSTDRTLEIAKKYTNKIIHFEWCGDFAAARNSGVDAARGEWFLFLDGDEWFDDVTELIDFFNSGECDQYGSASYIQRNYQSFDGEKYNDYHTCRIFRLLGDLHFNNKVHEDFPITAPTKMLDSFVHHYGYLFQTLESSDRKGKRNRDLLEEELKENPKDSKALEQLSMQLVECEPEKSVEYAERGMEIAKTMPEGNPRHLCTRFALCYLRANLNLKKNQETLQKIPEALSYENKRGVFHLELYRMGQLIAFALKQYETALKYGELYLELYREFEADQLDREVMMCAVFYYITPEVREEVLATCGAALLRLDRPQEAKNYLERLDLSKKIPFRNAVLPLCFEIADKLGEWDIASRLYETVKELNIPEKLQDFRTHANNYIFQYPSKRHAIVQAFANMEREDDAWILLSRMRVAEDDGDKEKVSDALQEMRRLKDYWDVSCAEALWYIIKEKINLVTFLSCINMDDIKTMADCLKMWHTDYSEILLSYVNAFSFQDAKALCCLSILLETVVVDKQSQKKPEYYRLFDAYIECQNGYTLAVYKPELLTERGLSVLPGSCRFGYYAGLALEAQRRGDGIGYLKNLRLGLKEYSIMKECVNFLLKDFEKKQEKRDEQEEEFFDLAKQVKRNIEGLIAQGDLKQAGAYTNQLAKLIPGDDDVRRYQRLTHTEPTMDELATWLPQ